MVNPALRAWCDGTEMADPVAGFIQPQPLGSNDLGAVIVMPRAGTLKNLYMRIEVPTGGVTTKIFRVLVGGLPTGITVTFTGADVEKNDLVNTFAVVAGDKVAIDIGGDDSAELQTCRAELELA